MNTDEKVFSREEAEAIVESRLARERRNTEQLLPIRELIHRLRKQEPYRSLSTAELSSLIIKMLDSALKDKDLSASSRSDGIAAANASRMTADVSNESAVETENTSPELMTKEAVPSEPETTRPASENRKTDGGVTEPNESFLQKDGAPQEFSADETHEDAEEKLRERRREDIREFLAEYGEDTLLSALSDDAFKHFCVGKSGNLRTLYRGYLAFLSALTDSKSARLCRAAERQLASTGFSNTASGAPDYGALLTENQKSIARSSGMSYRDYAALLEQIPAKRL